MSKTKIEWTDTTWNPVRGCSRVSEGCRNCYAERMAARFSGDARGNNPYQEGFVAQPFHGFAIMTDSGPRWTGRVELIEAKLEEPLHWRKPRMVFVNSMSDLFHEALPDEAIDRVMATIILSDSHRAQPRNHTMQVLTKRSKRMRDYMEDPDTPFRVASWISLHTVGYRPTRGTFDWHAITPWPPDNLWLGVSVEDQATADARILDLQVTPAAVRFVSYEPALGPVDLSRYVEPHWTALNLVICGGESGPGARPCNVAWIRSIIRQCRDAEVKCFVKQIGSNPFDAPRYRQEVPWPADTCWRNCAEPGLRDRKGGDPDEWPEDLRVRQMPEVR